ncbi:MAG: triose-phosphate isomerase [Candidatus Hadarchaeota archaeon]
MLKTPIVVLNLKTYKEATGERALELCKLVEKVAANYDASVAVCPQQADVYRIASRVKIPVLAQHVDAATPGKNTGWITPESVKAAGAVGTLLNHAEHKIPIEQIKKTIELLKPLGLSCIVCTADVEESKKAAALSPDMIAVEPPELIGSGVSVSKAKPEVVSGSVDAIKRVNPKVEVLCGAGITTGDDIIKAIELGTKGVLLASGIVLAKDQRAAIEDMVRALPR